ncbi:MAG: glycosyltransferase family 87 protein [Pseudolabrys sp.]|nr:glycosyltransferase family 87 protein [Pseudolabrys sp.]MDP2294189.1 glycosyltransferase family 87 protein [Pseudolabrys sp.]
MAGLIDLLRTGAFVTRERVRLVAFGVLAASLIGIVFLLAGSTGLNDSYGRPLGTDFASFYAAGTLVHDGLAAQAYDPAVHFAREQAIFGPAAQYYAFQYPPVFLLVGAALAALPYLPALVIWQTATLLLYLLAMRAVLLIPPPQGEGVAAPLARSRASSTRYGAVTGGVNSSEETVTPPGLLRSPPSPFRGGIKKDWLLLALAFPAVFINLGHGQNGFLTVALFAGALALLDRRPLAAGVLIGLMIYKPQFGLMIPLVLVATGRWRVIVAAAMTIAVLLLVTLLAFGPAVWPAFLASMTFTRVVLLEQGDVGFFKMQSVFAWVRLWSGPVTLAYIVQSAVTLGVAAALIWFWRSRARYPLKAAALLIGTLLATPFCLDYDLMLLAPAIAFLAIDGQRDGFCYWHKTVLAALWLVPLVARSVAEAVSIPLAAPGMLAAFVFVLQRAISDGTGLQGDGASASSSLK